jgi:hypothetical protein
MRPSPALIVATVALITALSGAALALPGHNTVSADDIRRNAVASQEVKQRSLRGGDLKDETITGRQVRGDSLGADRIDTYSVADDSLVRVAATTGADEASARADAPELELYREGPLTVYAKCFRDAADSDVLGEIFVRTDENGALLEGADDLPGVNGPSLLTTGTPEADRQLDVEEVADVSLASFDEAQGAAAGPDGTSFRALTTIGVKQGSLPGGDGAFGGGNVCLFGLETIG